MSKLRRKSREYSAHIRDQFQRDPFSTIILYSVLLSILFLVFAFRGLIATAFIKPLGVINPGISKVFNAEQEPLPETEEETEDLPGSFTLRSSDTYEVKSGDTLSSIANTLGIEWQALADFNDIEPPYSLTVGQVLKIPPQD